MNELDLSLNMNTFNDDFWLRLGALFRGLLTAIKENKNEWKVKCNDFWSDYTETDL